MYKPVYVSIGEHDRLFPAFRQPSQESAASEKLAAGKISRIQTISNSWKYASSTWSAYNPFTVNGRHTLLRKVLSSGPAALSSRPDSIASANPKGNWTGWRAGTRFCCIAVASCLIIELILLIWAVANDNGTGSGVLFASDCATVSSFEVWLLLPLNIAATVLIGTSNYVMQVMSAPSREEIDSAHQYGESIPVGGISFNSLKTSKSGRPRRIVWWILALSSLPIHLLLNVAFYGSVGVSDTGVLVVSGDFADDSSWTFCDSDSSQRSFTANFTCAMKQAFDKNETREISTSQCKTQSALGFQTNASSLIVVADSNSRSWYNLPLDAKLPDSYGIPCSQNVTQDVNGLHTVYLRNTTSKPSFHFGYSPETGSVSVTRESSSMCLNETRSGGRLTRDETGQTWNLQPYTDNKNWSYTNTGTLLHHQNDTITNVTSVLSVFDAIDYRYWAIAQETGDYLDPQLTSSSRGWDTRSWVCPASSLAAKRWCDPTQVNIDTGWVITPSNISVKACHVVPKQEQCALHYSLKILIITMCCDMIKLAAMISALKLVSRPLTTLGDLIKSFLQSPDIYTKHRCLIDHDESVKWTNRVRTKAVTEVRKYLLPLGYDWRGGSCQKLLSRRVPGGECDPTPFQFEALNYLMDGGQWWANVEPPPKDNTWLPRPKRWFVVPSTLRWWILAALYSALMIFLIIYLTFGVNSVRKQGIALNWTVGFGGPDPGALWIGGIFSGVTSITWVAILINLPQVIFSFMYFILNATLTMMHTANEWSLFAKQRKALRVSSPKGNQRATYWLQLPWSYSIPLIVASGTLHWLLSRSIYLVKIDVSGYFGERITDRDFFACGYSPITVLLLVILLILMALALALMSCRRLHPGMPFVRFSSLAIAAACHPDPSEKDLMLEPLMWGVIDTPDEDGALHCSFSAREVTPLNKGVVYA